MRKNLLNAMSRFRRSYGRSFSSGGGGNPLPPSFLLDTFTDSNGTPIQNHVMNSGLGWSVLDGSGEIDSNSLDSVTSGTEMIITTPARFSDGSLAVYITIPGSGQFSNAILARMLDVNSGWAFTLENDGVSTTASIVELGGLI